MSGKTLGRREFLRIVGVSGIAGLTALKLGWKHIAENATTVSETRLLMGTVVNLTMIANDAQTGKAAINACLGHMGSLESVFSRYRPDSELSKLNREGDLKQASPHLITVLQQAAHISSQTGGAFDVTVKPAIDLYQDNQKAGRGLPTAAEINSALLRVGYRHLNINGADVSFDQPGMGLTLDGIAKGYIIDQGVMVLRQHGFVNVLVEAGGDLSAAGTKPGASPWQIGIQSPRDGQLLQRFKVNNQAVATSGDYMQSFTPDFTHHHILDPRTGYSAPELASVTLIAPTAMLADALATAVMVMGADGGLALIESMSGCEMVALTKTLDVLRSSGWL